MYKLQTTSFYPPKKLRFGHFTSRCRVTQSVFFFVFFPGPKTFLTMCRETRRAYFHIPGECRASLVTLYLFLFFLYFISVFNLTPFRSARFHRLGHVTDITFFKKGFRELNLPFFYCLLSIFFVFVLTAHRVVLTEKSKSHFDGF